MTNIFESRFEDLKNFITEHNRFPKNAKKGDDYERVLARWCQTRKQEYKKGILDENKISKLLTIDGWFWEFDNFDERYQELKDWIEKYGEMPYRNEKDKKRNSLYNWCNGIRQKFRKNKLSPEKINQMNNIKLWKWAHDDFDEKYNELLQWIEINNKLPSI